MESQSHNCRESGCGRLDEQDAGLHRPRSPPGCLETLFHWERSVLVPQHSPVAVVRLVEQRSSEGTCLPTQKTLRNLYQALISCDGGDDGNAQKVASPGATSMHRASRYRLTQTIYLVLSENVRDHPESGRFQVFQCGFSVA